MSTLPTSLITNPDAAPTACGPDSLPLACGRTMQYISTFLRFQPDFRLLALVRPFSHKIGQHNLLFLEIPCCILNVKGGQTRGRRFTPTRIRKELNDCLVCCWGQHYTGTMSKGHGLATPLKPAGAGRALKARPSYIDPWFIFQPWTFYLLGFKFGLINIKHLCPQAWPWCYSVLL